jgi:hypothetical protein
VLRDPKGDDDRTETNLIAVDEPMRNRHTVSPDVGPVLALQILERRVSLSNNNARVVT